MNGKTEYPKGELFTIDLKKGDERVEFGFGLIINGRNYLEIVRIIPDSDAARSPLKIRDILLTIGGEEIFKKGKEVYYAAIHKIAEGAVATMRFCHPLLYTTIENLSEQQTSSYFERLKSAVDNDDPSAMQTVNNSLYEYHIQLMNSDVVWPLHRAIMGNHVKVAEILTSNYGILDLDAFSETYKGTTLTLAARSGQYDIVEKLLSSGAYSSHPLSLSWNPLRIAIQSGHDEVALLLAEKHRDLQSAKTVAYKCLIHLAVANGRLNLLDRWWKEGMNPNQSMPEDLSSDSDFSPSHTLATALTKYEASQNDDEKEGRRKIVAFLLDKGASIDDEIMRSCFTAVTSYMNWQKGANSWTIVNLSNVKTIDFKRWLTPENGSLTALDLSNSLIKTLPSSVPWDFPNIRAFVMNNCKELTELSESKDAKPSCKKLTTVSLCYNPKLTTLPLNYFRLKNLTELKVMQCALSFLPWSNDNLVEDTKAWKCLKLKVLKMNGNRLREFSVSLPKGVLKLIDLSDNQLTCINVSSCSKSLKKLYLKNNQFRTFPDSVCALEKLIELDISQNFIEQLPVSEWNCRDLDNLNLAQNKLGHSTSNNLEVNLPKVCDDRLSELNLSDNELQVIPDSVINFRRLFSLNISNNAITSIPPALASLRKLKVLNVTGLNLSKMPKELNPAFMAPKLVLTANIMTYLTNQYRKKIGFHRVKLIVLGDDDCGKTKVIQTLTGNGKFFEQDAIVGFTDWSLRNDKKASPIDVTILELRGEEYQQFHRVFITPKAHYLIVVRLDKPISKNLYNYLLSIKERSAGANASVFVVATHLDNLSLNGNNITSKKAATNEVINKLARSVGCQLNEKMFSVDTGKEKTLLLEALLSSFTSQIQGEIVPESYVTIANQICGDESRLKRNAINLTSLLATVQKANTVDIDINDPEEINHVISLFNERGVFLHHDTTQKGKDHEWFYLNPTWLSQAMTALIKNQSRLRQHKIQDLLDVLKRSLQVGNSCADDVIDIMLRFELIMKLDNKHALILNNLPQEGPETSFKLDGSHVCRLYRLQNTPPGFWSRLIGRLIILFNATPQMSASEPDDARIHYFSLPRRLEKEMTFYWAKGYQLKSKKGLLRVEPLEKSQLAAGIKGDNFCNGVLVSWHWTDRKDGHKYEEDWSDQPYFGMTIDEIDQLLQEWYPYADENTNVQKQAICSICSEKYFTGNLNNFAYPSTDNSSNYVKLRVNGPLISVMSLKDVTGLATVTNEVTCEQHVNENVPLENLIPDLLMLDLIKTYRIEHRIDIIGPLGKGGQAAVFKGSLPNGELCAAKTFFRAEEFGAQLALYTASRTVDDRLSFIANERNPLRPSIVYGLTSDPSLVTAERSFTAGREWIESQTLAALSAMRREATILCKLNHPLIIRMLGIVVEPHRPFYILLELAKEGNMCDYILKCAKRTKREKRKRATVDAETFCGLFADRYFIYKLAWQIAIALEYLHNEEIIYHDLKPQNVLLFSKDPKDNVIAKLSDFAISRQADPQGNMGSKGTLGYQAPELLDSAVYNAQVDIYSYGMLLYLLLAGEHPFYEFTGPDVFVQVAEKVRFGIRPSLMRASVKPNFASLEAMMQKCWAAKPSDRPAASDLRQEFETLSFYSLRDIIDVEPSPAESLPKHNGAIFYVDPLIDTSQTTSLLAIPQSNSVCIVAGDGSRYQMTVINTENSEKITMTLKTDQHITLLAASSDLLFFLCDKSIPDDPTSEERVLILNAPECDSSMISPSVVLGALKLSFTDETSATAFCAYRSSQSPVQHKLFVGYASGMIARYTLPFDNQDKPAWNDAHIVRLRDKMPINALECHQFDSDSEVELLVAVGNTIQSLSTTTDTVLRLFPTSTPMNYIRIVDKTIWVGSQSLSLVEKISIATETDVDTARWLQLDEDENSELKMTGMTLVADNLWCACGNVIRLFASNGSPLGSITCSSSDADTIEAIEVCGSTVISLIRTADGRKKKLMIFEALSEEHIQQLKMDWNHWRNI